MATSFIPMPEVPTDLSISLWNFTYALRDTCLKLIDLFRRTDAAWVYPILNNDWQGYSAVTDNQQWPGLAYWKSPADIVYVRGLVKGGTPSEDNFVCILPKGYRPEYRQAFPTVCFDADVSARIDISPDGKIMIIEGSTNWTSTSFSFRAQAGGQVRARTLGMG